MISGKLDKRITIQQQGTTTSDSGQRTITWSNLATNVPARIIYESGNEGPEGPQRVAQTNITFEVRYPRSFTIAATMRILHDSLYYNIVAIEEKQRRVALHLRCEQKDNSNA